MLLGGAVAMPIGNAVGKGAISAIELEKMLLRFALMQNWESRGENADVPG